MCGIAGAAWTTEGTPVPRQILERMTTALAHRGPDGSGCYLSAERSPGTTAQAALGQRRLSIIDLAGGGQPLSNEDGTVWITFNGEIYNYVELQTQLVAQGHVFRTASDTEVIVHLYEQYGTECVQHLRGMFAFAIWNERTHELFFARDRLGKKPLLYRNEPRRLLFASELKALLQVPGVPRELDPAALDDYLTYQYVPHPQCILKGFHKLPPAHWALWRNGELNVERYWRPGYELGPLPPEEERHASARLRETLTEAVKLRLRSDVPLGAFLSGGIDSTIVAGLMQQESPQRIKTFSIGFPVKQFDERHYARMAAEHLKTDHHEQVVDPSAVTLLPKLIWHYDEPFADSSAIPTMYLAEMTRKHVIVALSGDGGDELFAGYERYRAVQLGGWVDRLPRFARQILGASLWQRLPASVQQRSRRRRLKRLLSGLGLPREQRYLRWVSIFDDERRPTLYSPAFRDRLAAHRSEQFLLDAYLECPGRDFVTQTTCADVLTYLPCDILNKVDIATMAYGLEARCPFLDQHVVELSARLPLSQKLRGGIGKRILVETFQDLLPPAIQTRRKMGFGVPLDHWFRGELQPYLKSVLLDPSSLNRGIFEPRVVESLVHEHTAGQWDHSYRLWSLLVLELWQREWLDGSSSQG